MSNSQGEQRQINTRMVQIKPGVWVPEAKTPGEFGYTNSTRQEIQKLLVEWEQKYGPSNTPPRSDTSTDKIKRPSQNGGSFSNYDDTHLKLDTNFLTC